MDLVGPTSHRFVSQRLNLHYADWGNRDAPPLILVHGGRDHCRSWDWVAQELRKDFHVIAPDLRGHGDSDWSPDGNYASPFFIYDLAQLIHHLKLAPVSIVAHSLGGNIAIRYAGLYPKNVRRLVAIEGLGPSPKMQAEFDKIGLAQRMRDWIDNRRAAAGRTRRKYATFEEAFTRMKDENKFLTDEQARRLTEHGAVRNEDGTWSWKFDDYLRIFPAYDFPVADDHALWAAIECPTLLVYGEKSWASNPLADGRAAHFRNAEVKVFADAGHWVHHDRFDEFVAELRRFL
ncbi:MAG: alpha/beta hydrolase [Parvularculaceae bacterium]|jgi:pimeloyl-ACP methyl ester carboxylesterase|nr:alpha/beta hydrolase [Parvularculaceae bacterium]